MPEQRYANTTQARIHRERESCRKTRRGPGRASVFSGVSHLSCCSVRLHFKNATDETDRIINHVSIKHTHTHKHMDVDAACAVMSAGCVCLQES